MERLDAQACRNRCRAEQGVDGDGKQTLAAVCVGSSVENIFVADLVGVHKDCCSYQVSAATVSFLDMLHVHPSYTPIHPLTRTRAAARGSACSSP